MEMCVLAWRWMRAFCLFMFFVSFASIVEGAGKVVHVCLACVSRV